MKRNPTKCEKWRVKRQKTGVFAAGSDEMRVRMVEFAGDFLPVTGLSVMKVIQQLAELPAAHEQAVIINCGTKWVSTLALLSCRRHAAMPVLIIDCESADGSREHFETLARERGVDFHWLSWPLRPHGDTLDRLLREIRSEMVLLVDSDVEIREARVVAEMQQQLVANKQAYGAGFLQPAGWLGPPHHLLPPQTGYYAERMWIPLVLLRVECVRAALTAGASFIARRPFQEISGHPRLSRLLGYRFRIPLLRSLRLPQWLCKARPGDFVIDGVKPAFVDHDTGAELHLRLTLGGHPFVKLDEALWGQVHHYHGVTRARIGGWFRALAAKTGMVSKETQAAPLSAEEDARNRLREQYGFEQNKK